MANDEVSILLRIRGRAKASQEVKQLRGDMGKLDNAQDRVAKSSDRAAKSSGRMSKGIGVLRRAAVVGVVAVASIATALGGKMVAEQREAIKVTRDTSAVIKSMGADSWTSSKQIADLSSRQSTKNAIDDEAIQKGLNMLLTFKNVRNELGKGNNLLDRSSQAAIDLSARFGKDLNQSMIMVGKAVNDPIKGLTALGRTGVQFTQGQKDQVKALVESGQTMKAQKLILKELESQVKGSAAAQADPIDKAKVAWNNLLETLGGYIAPVIYTVATAFADLIGQMQTGTGVGGAIVDVVTTLGPVLAGVAGAAWAVGKGIISVVNGFKEGKTWAVLLVGGVAMLTGAWLGYQLVMTALAVKTAVMTGAQWALNAAMTANPVGLIVAGIAALVVGLVLAYKKVGWFRNAVNAVFGFIKKHWMALAWILTGGLVPIIVLIVRNFGKIKRAAGSVIGFVKKNWPILIGILTGGLVPAIILVVRNFGRIKRAASDAFNGVRRIVKSVVNGIIGIWNRLDFGIHIRVPSWVPGVGGKGFNVNDIFPDIPQLQYGGVTGGGPVLWNERVGGEIAMFPRGTRIEPTARVDRTEPLDLGSGDIVIENHFYVDGHEVAKIVDRRVGNVRARR